MSKKNKKTSIKDELLKECASANDCTGILQKISLDKEEIAAFHRMFNGEDK